MTSLSPRFSPRLPTFFFTLLWLLTLGGFAHAELPPPEDKVNRVAISLVSDLDAVAPGETIRLGVYFRPDTEWHVYWRYAGGTGLPTQIHLDIEDGLQPGAIAWPRPQRFVDSLGDESFGYEKEVLLVTEIAVPEDILEGSELPFVVDLEWLVCKTNCIPGKTRVGLKIPVQDTPLEERKSKEYESFDLWAKKVPLSNPPVKWESSVSPDAVAPRQPFEASIRFQGLTLDPSIVAEERVLPASGDFKIVTASFEEKDGDLITTISGEASRRGQADYFDLMFQLADADGPLAFDLRLPISRTDLHLTQRSPSPAPGDSPVLQTAETTGSDSSSTALNSFFIALFFAFLGGLILNAMPCVLPVLSLKIMGIIEQSQDEPKVIWRHGLAYTAGVLLSFLAFALLLIVLQQRAWAFQFQDPTFVAVFTTVVFAFALSLFGVFDLSLPGAGRLDAKVANSSGLMSSFNYGVFAVLLGTPCTAPFLGPALTYAFTRPALEMTILLLTVGFGLAFPFLILARFPAWRRFMPKPGPWLLTFKKVMGFLLVGTAVWMIAIFIRQVSEAAVVSFLVFLAILSFALWLYGHTNSPIQGARTRLIGSAVAIALTLGSGYTLISTEPKPANAAVEEIAGLTWHNFDLVDVESLAGEGELVFVDFTADWCATCKVNEARAIHTQNTRALFEEHGVVAVKGDYTRPNEHIKMWLDRFEEPSVPLYIVIPKGHPDKAFKLPTLLSEKDVREGISRAQQIAQATP